MKYFVVVTSFVFLFTAASATEPGRRTPAKPAAAGGAQGQTIARYADAVQERAFRGCDRNTSVLEGTDNPGAAGAGAGGATTGSGGGQR